MGRRHPAGDPTLAAVIHPLIVVRSWVVYVLLVRTLCGAARSSACGEAAPPSQPSSPSSRGLARTGFSVAMGRTWFSRAVPPRQRGGVASPWRVAPASGSAGGGASDVRGDVNVLVGAAGDAASVAACGGADAAAGLRRSRHPCTGAATEELTHLVDTHPAQYAVGECPSGGAGAKPARSVTTPPQGGGVAGSGLPLLNAGHEYGEGNGGTTGGEADGSGAGDDEGDGGVEGEDAPARGDGDDDAASDEELAAWRTFEEDCDEGGSSSATSLSSSSSGSSSARAQHPLDAAFFDEVLQEDELQPGARPFLTKQEFFSFLTVSTTVGLTVQQYDIMRSFCNADQPRQELLPCYSTISKRVIPAALKAGGLPMQPLEENGGKCWLVLPSSHVRRDFAFQDTYLKFFRAEDRDEEARDLEPEYYDTAFFQNKAGVLQHGSQPSSFCVNGSRFRCGSVISLTLDGADAVKGLKVDHAYFASSESGVGADNDVYAGDLVIVCETCDGEAAGLFVSRHWMPVSVDALCWLPSAGGSCYCVVRIDVEGSADDGVDACRNSTGAYPAPTASTRRVRGMGVDGIPTVVACIALYSDDFLCREKRKQSAGGVYMFYPGWCVADRVGRPAVRTISVTTPGLSSDLILEAIMPDLIAGSTTGWLVKDYKGAPVRVMADMSFYVGDYVQVSKSSRMRGHNAHAPCPLCAYSLPGGQGCQFDGPASSDDTGLMRTSRRTAAVLQAVREIE